MDDRTMLELAAKAAGHSLGDGWDECGEGYGVIINGTGCGDGEFWNPLTSDGDALRLAVKLNMGISIPVMRTPMADVVTFRDSIINVREKGNDILAATRRAITRAAAEIQLAKENGK